ncbi:uncharacterized protein LOC135125973 [Zophobas morio]|uniref:uncharacterized protein LOC135125973 n=1 Tax=Zophobas morio TaxID=2755281 RepID=UPI003082B824
MFSTNLVTICVIFTPIVTQLAAQTCQLDLLVRPETIPLVIKINNNSYYYPVPTAYDDRLLDFLYEEDAIFVCPGGHFNQPGFNPDGQHGWCKGGGGFMCDWLLTFYHTMNCTMIDIMRPFLSESYDNSGTSCQNSDRNIQVGYQIDDVLVPVYDICFNGETLMATYTRHVLTRFAPLASVMRPPPSHYFFLVSLYQTDVEAIYDNFVTYFSELGVQDYVNDTYFLTPGHLVPYEDFLSPFQKDAAYHFANVAPQWNTFDEGNWKVLETGILTFIANSTTFEGVLIVGDATVLTGTLKVATLAGSTGTTTELYLTQGRFPVPRWFWKIIYFAAVNTGVIFFGYNNPFATKGDVDAEFVAEVCSVDVFELVRDEWYLDDVDNGSPGLGLMYACRLHLDQILDPVVNGVVDNLLPEGVTKAELL